MKDLISQLERAQSSCGDHCINLDHSVRECVTALVAWITWEELQIKNDPYVGAEINRLISDGKNAPSALAAELERLT